MARSPRWQLSISALLSAALLSACGGGGDSPSASAGPSTSSTIPDASAADAPAFTGDIATDGFNWINYRRNQSGLSVLSSNSTVATAALNHSKYQVAHNLVSHNEVQGNAGFTGYDLPARLQAVGYVLTQNAGYAYGEVISAASASSGVVLAENLFTAIYHRFVMFEPAFKEGGAGAATAGSGYTYFTADLTAINGYGPGITRGTVITYPFATQTGVPLNFFSDTETPDPVPNQNEVGYPVSVHTNIDATLTVQSFTMRPHGGINLTTRLLSSATDSNPDTPKSAAAIIPMAPLSTATVYDVTFLGTVDNVPVTKNWSFTTQ